MYFDGEFRHIGNVDPQPLACAVEALGEDAWQEYVRRQEMFAPHRQTHTVPLLFDERMPDTGRPTAWPRYAKFEPLIEPVLVKIRENGPPTAKAGSEGYFIRIILTRMAPGTVIPPHRDHGPSMLRCHRYHYAIITNPLVEFGIENTIKHCAAGEIWEINNRKLHAVRNLGEKSRVHLIVDYVMPGEEIHDPDGLVIA